MEVMFNEFCISNDKTRIDKDIVIDFLSRSYWANKRPIDRTIKAIENSYCLGVYKDEKQVGFARVISDGATFFYICDVFVLEEYRGKGIGKKLVEIIVDSDEFEGMMGLLGTLDAHGLYEKYGFIKDPDRFLKRPPTWSVQQQS
ncbi:GNAT family N-acetyltransferase [Cohnella faecalis]|uniref:N-acetyltransferase n=1 Tax=Cohnella faecalis TaxID=2315694 RepID=A0A398CGN4_9BACL|nr:GNAT family N-acetyltransferase [Cohnella faecalis]RIE01633.1 N-acetyltransferase [Cohnella faecalis]RIE01638.1 N-acetyltransferase [Cohnella faecalis]RIE01640.1 N-acetyltransferase [Cohnella faecalis]RIE01699.1 N-acetyltransferase [Cohnella faecalis]